MQGWMVVRTQRNREAWAAENIDRQEAELYFPRFVESRVKSGVVVTQVKALFPSYIFVKARDGQWRFLLGTYGVVSVIMGANQLPAIVQEGEIVKLRACENSDGWIQLPKVTSPGRFKVGTKVRVLDGPYTGYVGLYDGCGSRDRERILLEYLGRKTSVLIAGEQLVEV